MSAARNITIDEAIERVRSQRAIDTATAAVLLDVSPDVLWRLARDGDEGPVPYYRAGRVIRWVSGPILTLLQIDANGGGNGVEARPLI